MSVYQKQLKVPTGRKQEALDITADVAEAVAASGVSVGLCNIFVTHTTAGVMANEHFDPNVGSDILRCLDTLAPEQARWDHPEGNAPAHVKSSLVNASLTVPVSDGDLAVGQWQGIFLMEFDGPRKRTVVITVTGE